MNIRLLTLAVLAGAAATAHAQSPAAPAPAAAASPAATPRPAPAPRETQSALIAGKKVAIEYGRPSLHGRTLSELLAKLPEDRIWRAGVDEATTLTAEGDLLIGDARVPAGKYTVYMYLPENAPAALVLNKDLGIELHKIYDKAPAEKANALWPHLEGYGNIKATEIARIPLASVKPDQPMDQFLIRFEPAKDGQSALTFTWGDQAWTVGVRAAQAVR